jgi:hypothetical protein
MHFDADEIWKRKTLHKCSKIECVMDLNNDIVENQKKPSDIKIMSKIDWKLPDNDETMNSYDN